MLRELSAKCRVSAEEIGTCMNTDSTLKAGHLHFEAERNPEEILHNRLLYCTRTVLASPFRQISCSL